MVAAYIGLGSNQQQPLQQLQAAVNALAALPSSQITKISPIYAGPFIGGDPKHVHAEVFNAVLLLNTVLEPEELLTTLQTIEQQQGRVRKEVYSDRTIDLDLLIYAREQRDTPVLQLPHPRMHTRAFVMRPLCDIAAELILPTGLSVYELCDLLVVDDLIKTPHILHIPTQSFQNAS